MVVAEIVVDVVAPLSVAEAVASLEVAAILMLSFPLAKGS